MWRGMTEAPRCAAAIALALALAGCTPDRAQPETGTTALPAATPAARCGAGGDATSVRTAAGECLVLARGHDAGPGKPLVVFLHGDSGGGISAGAWDAYRARAAGWGQAASATSVALARAGYRTHVGRSAGTAKPNDDDYTAENVRLVAGALVALRQRLAPSRVILVGHSGGAATAALVGALHPGAADALVLAACPCATISEWRAWRAVSAGRGGNWPDSLSPLSHADRLPAGMPVLVLTGAQDTNTLPEYGRRFADRARAAGASAVFNVVPGADHGSVVATPAVTEAIVLLAR